MIIEDYRSCAWPFYSLLHIFPKALHSDLQGGGDYTTGLVQTSSDETRPWSSSPLIVSRDSFSPWTWVRLQSIAYSGGRLYIFLIVDISLTGLTKPTDRPKSARNRCVIEDFGGVFVLSPWFFLFVCVGFFFHRTESDLFLFLYIFQHL